jgi:hypothetical protein
LLDLQIFVSMALKRHGLRYSKGRGVDLGQSSDKIHRGGVERD